MANLTHRVEFRLDEESYKKLQAKAKESKNRSISDFYRNSLLENNGLCSAAMKKQMRDLRWEINKIGTNINQVAKRVNSGLGSARDIEELYSYQEQLISLMEKYLEEVESLWQ